MEKMEIFYEKDICFLNSTGFPIFFSNRAFAILLEYVLVDHTEIDIDM